ncbi:MAG: hypothetical protein WD847_21840 [Pirellulales bacterium]
MKRVAITLAVLVGLFVASESAMAAAPVRRVVGFGYGYGVRPVMRLPARVVVPAARVVTPRFVPAPRVYVGPRYGPSYGPSYGPAIGPVYGPVYRGYYPGYVLPRRGMAVLY